MVYVVTNWSIRLEEHLTIEILFIVDFLRIFKSIAFYDFFRDFLNSLVAHAKIV